MQLRLWLRRTLWGALIVSLLVHLGGIFSEEIYYWVTQPEFEQTELKQPSQQLKAMSLDEAAQTELAGITPPDTLEVRLRPPAAKQPSSKPVRATPKSAPRTRPLPPVASVVDEASTIAARIETSAPDPVAASEPAAPPASATPAVVAVASAPREQPVSQPDTAPLRYPSELDITYVYGIIPARMTWKIHNGQYDLRLEGGFLGKSRTFLSHGKVDRHGVRPDRFQEYRDGKDEPRYQIDFDWTAMTAEVGEPGKRKIEPLANGDQDIFSTAFHIGLIGGNQSEHRFAIFSGRRKYENAVLRVMGEAQLRLGQKEVTALLLRGEWDDRRADFWLAPEWHNIPVRITFTMKELELDIWANDITIEGKKVLEWVRPGSTQTKRTRDHSSNR